MKTSPSRQSWVPWFLLGTGVLIAVLWTVRGLDVGASTSKTGVAVDTVARGPFEPEARHPRRGGW